VLVTNSILWINVVIIFTAVVISFACSFASFAISLTAFAISLAAIPVCFVASFKNSIDFFVSVASKIPLFNYLLNT